MNNDTTTGSGSYPPQPGRQDNTHGTGTGGTGGTGGVGLAGVSGHTDLVLDALADLKQLVAGWSPQAWQLLADMAGQASAGPRGPVECARSRALVAAVEHNRMELVRYTRDELRHLIPLTLIPWAHATAGQALDDAALAMITADMITTTDFDQLLSACRRAADH